ncbi:MAG: hypothetical protein QM786_10445 [Breznakibacter sp.]
MVDRERRQKLALHLRHLSVGLISNDGFESNLMDDVTNGWLPEQYYRAKQARFDDPIIQPMLEFCWGLYDDTRNHKLKGPDELSVESLKVIARCILFLHSDQEYKWPYFDTNSPLFKFSVKEIAACILTFGQYYRDKREQQVQAYLEFQKNGNFEVWPFMTERDYKAQLVKQPFLGRKF